jgi:hypothetical protein
MKRIFLLIMLFVGSVMAQGRLTDADFATLAQIQAASGTAANLLNDDKVYIKANGINKTLNQAVADGNIATTAVDSSILSIAAVSSSYTIPSNIDLVLASGTITVTLPTADVSNTGRVITVKNTSTRPTNAGASNAVVLIQTSPSTQLIDGVSASTSLVNFGESIDLVSDGSTWYYRDIDARVRKFSVNYGGATQFLQCTTSLCPLYHNTGAVSGVARPGVGNIRLETMPRTCRSIPSCTLLAANNTNQITTVPQNTSSTTAVVVGVAIPGTGGDNSWGLFNCTCDRW